MRLSRNQYLSTALIGACTTAYVLQTLSPSLVGRFGVLGTAVADGEVHRLLTGAFLHAGALHLVVNMLALHALGRILEGAFTDRWRFPVIYFGSALGGSLGACLLDPTTVAVGASGAIYGMLGAVLAVSRRRGYSWNHTGVVPWIGLNLVFTFAFPGVSIGGHLGGLLTGFLLAWTVTDR